MTDRLETFQAIEIRALDRYNAAVALTNSIEWGGHGEAAALLDEGVRRVEWLHARRARIDAETERNSRRNSLERKSM